MKKILRKEEIRNCRWRAPCKDGPAWRHWRRDAQTQTLFSHPVLEDLPTHAQPLWHAYMDPPHLWGFCPSLAFYPPPHPLTWSQISLSYMLEVSLSEQYCLLLRQLWIGLILRNTILLISFSKESRWIFPATKSSPVIFLISTWPRDSEEDSREAVKTQNRNIWIKPRKRILLISNQGTK